MVVSGKSLVHRSRQPLSHSFKGCSGPEVPVCARALQQARTLSRVKDHGRDSFAVTTSYYDSLRSLCAYVPVCLKCTSLYISIFIFFKEQVFNLVLKSLLVSIPHATFLSGLPHHP